MQRKPSKSDVTVSWGDFGDSWEHLGGSGGDLGASWEGLGRSWGHLGVVLGALGPSWPILGPSWGDLGLSWGDLEFFGSILVAKRVPKRRHFGSPNRRKIDPKTRSKFKSEKVASWDRLGSILGRFGRRPGGIFVDFLLVFVLFRGHRRFRC